MSTIMTCPNCATRLRVPDDAFAGDVCPQCFTALDNSGAAPVIRAPNLVRDVRRDSSATHWTILPLIGLCLLGVILTCFGVGTNEQVATVYGVLDLALMLPIYGISVLYWRESLAARILGLIGLIAGVIAAFLILFFVVCSVAVGIALQGRPLH